MDNLGNVTFSSNIRVLVALFRVTRKYIAGLRTEDNAAVSRGYALALGVLPRKIAGKALIPLFFPARYPLFCAGLKQSRQGTRGASSLLPTRRASSGEHIEIYRNLISSYPFAMGSPIFSSCCPFESCS